MADDKSKRGTPDRSKVSGKESYEVKYESNKLGVTPKKIQDAIKSVGNSRQKIEDKFKKK